MAFFVFKERNVNTIRKVISTILYIFLIVSFLTLGAMSAAVFVETKDWDFAKLAFLFFAMAVGIHLGE